MYAGFWKRALALILDSIIVSIVWGILFTLLMFYGMAGGANVGGSFIIMYALLMLLPIFYWVIFESTTLQATPGKMACGINVTDIDGKRLTFWRSFCRNLGKIVSFYFTFYAGLTMAGFTVKRQALHDKMAKCLVIKKDADTENLQPMPPQKTWIIVVSLITGFVLYMMVLLGFALSLIMPSVLTKIEATRVQSFMPVMAQVLTEQEQYKNTHGAYANSFAVLGTVLPGETEPEDEVTADIYDFNLALGRKALFVSNDNGSLPYSVLACYQSYRTTDNMCCIGNAAVCNALNMKQVESPDECC